MLEIIGIAAVAIFMHFATYDPGPKEVVVLLAEDDGSTGAVIVSSGDKSLRLDQAGQATGFDDKNPLSQAYLVTQDKIAALFGDALAAQPMPPRHFLLYFRNDSNELVPESAASLPSILEEIKHRPAPQIVIIGHTDTAGAASYNQQLGFQRAQLIYEAIVGIGANPSQITIESHGESNPIMPTADNVHEPKNRRVEVSVR